MRQLNANEMQTVAGGDAASAFVGTALALVGLSILADDYYYTPYYTTTTYVYDPYPYSTVVIYEDPYYYDYEVVYYY